MGGGDDPTFRDRATLPVTPEQPTVPARGAKPASVDHDPGPTPRRVSPFDEPRERFETREELGRGGMGVVVEAFDRALKRPVAIKQMQSASDADLARFEREAEITALLEHPGIVPIHDAGRSPDGLPYYVMRRIDGEPLDDVVRTKSFAERIARVPNVLAACDAVAFAHARGVIHRDIKPSNILIGPFGETLVIDWGLARMLDDAKEAPTTRNSDAQLTRAGSVAGTPGFMAPEQARGETLDPRADVYALGATLFYVLAGRVAFAASGSTEMIERVASGREPEWDKLPAETPPELRAIIEKAMAFERVARYRDASELAADLRRYVSGQFVGAYRYRFTEHVAMFVRRHRAAVAVGAIALAVIVLGAVFSVRRILDERDDARRARVVAEANQRDAAAKRDQLIVQHALHLVDVDPAAAIATLRRLGADSTEWRRAHIAAKAALARGIHFGFAIGDMQRLGRLAVAPRGHDLAAWAYYSDVVHVFDLDAKTRRAFTVRGQVLAVTWIDDRTLLARADTLVHVLDSRTGLRHTVTFPAPVVSVVEDRRGGALVSIEGRTTYRLRPDDTQPGDVVDMGGRDLGVLDDGRIVIKRSDRLDIVGPAGAETTIPGSADLVLVDGTNIVITTASEACVWNMSGPEPVRVRCVSLDAPAVPIALTESGLLFQGARPYIIPLDAPRQVIELCSGTGFRTPPGAIMMCGDGGLQIVDRFGVSSIPKRATSYRHVVQTEDERFVAALTSTGDVLVWDLAGYRPVAFDIPRGRQLFSLSTRAVWMFDNVGGGVFRLDPATGRETRVIDDAFILHAAVSKDEEWLITSDPSAGTQLATSIRMNVTLHNLETGFRRGSDGGAFAFYGKRAYHVTRAGELREVMRDGSERDVATLPFGDVVGLSATDDWLALELDDKVCRVKLARPAPDCMNKPRRLTKLALETDGRLWYIVDGQLWDWRVGAQPVRAWSGFVFKDLVFSDHDIVAAGTGVIVIVTQPASFPLGIGAMQRFMFGTKGRLFAVTAQGAVAIIDLQTGVTYELPIDAGVRTYSVAANDAGDVFALRDAFGRTQLLMYHQPVPSEPEALRQWLRTVTNARFMGDSDAIVWP